MLHDDACASAAESGRFVIEEATIAQILALLRAGELSAEQLCRMYIERIEKLDKDGPELNSVIQLNPDALALAKQIDKEWAKARRWRSALHGIPVLIKDNIATCDRMETTAGSLALLGSRPPADAFVVSQLHLAGAIILGKTNLSEWANFRGEHSSSGWSARGGQTRNPYVLARNPSGSSSGSAVAVSANLCPLAVGTETDGSIVSPASSCGIVGLKPTVGLINTGGIIPVSSSQDAPGPMARTVEDAALLLNALAVPQNQKKSMPGRDYTKYLNLEGLRDARLGVVRDLFHVDGQLDEVFADALKIMRKCGAELVDNLESLPSASIRDAEMEVLLYEFKAGLNQYLSWLGKGSPVHSLAEIIEFNYAHKPTELKFFGQELMQRAQEKGDLKSAGYIQSLAFCQKVARQQGLDLLISKHKLDALVSPTQGPAWLTNHRTGDHFTGSCARLPAVAGYPHITVPMGFIAGLPVGMSFIGAAWSEPTLFKLAYAFEQHSRARKAPAFAGAD